jgi:hypothetical protein
MRQMIVLAVSAALAGCQTAAQQTPEAVAEATRALPTNYRQMIVDRSKQEFFDPYSIRDVSISAPIPGTSFMGAVVTVCMRANAKNRMGGYTGLQATAFVFREGRITTTAGGDHGYIACEGAIYGPFPEIEAGKHRV